MLDAISTLLTAPVSLMNFYRVVLLRPNKQAQNRPRLNYISHTTFYYIYMPKDLLMLVRFRWARSISDSSTGFDSCSQLCSQRVPGV